MPYTDVFISHKAEDTEKAKKLRNLIRTWQFSCYIDADDKKLQAIKDPEEMAQHIRDNLRGCRVLIYAYSAASQRSRWMPWELGFFDGRWGSGQIGLYDLDESTGRSEIPDKQAPQADEALSLQEYLQIYTPLDRDTLRPFLEQRTSTTALSNRADVDADRFAALLAGALRNPADFSIGCLQYAVSFQQAFWQQGPLPKGFRTPLNAIEDGLARLRRLTPWFEPPQGAGGQSEEVARWMADAHADAIKRTG